VLQGGRGCLMLLQGLQGTGLSVPPLGPGWVQLQQHGRESGGCHSVDEDFIKQLLWSCNNGAIGPP